MYVPLNIVYGPWWTRQECRLCELSADEYPVQIVQSHGVNIAEITTNIIANVFLDELKTQHRHLVETYYWINAYMGTLSTQMSHSLLECRKGYIAVFFAVAVHSK